MQTLNLTDPRKLNIFFFSGAHKNPNSFRLRKGIAPFVCKGQEISIPGVYFFYPGHREGEVEWDMCPDTILAFRLNTPCQKQLLTLPPSRIGRKGLCQWKKEINSW
ncbi:hypothetical protein CEXT_568961 [Caerostris extrusa]|uniref:Uncharacterized protein n=1 Tax=Caerostris extrusa TaxID=172846 RepID=A0AAV4RT57_CAEEX|nr:hypothetical protein CEXT_568961 [Caerostris extrusa]